MSSKHIKLYFSISDSGKTIDLSNENDNYNRQHLSLDSMPEFEEIPYKHIAKLRM
jgi:hypothetical protein